MREAEDARLEDILKKLNWSLEERVKWIKYYCREVFGPNVVENVNQYGLGIMIFEKPAFFDLAEAGTGKNAIANAIEIGKRKLEETVKRRRSRG
jgi:hypothetical protein